MTIKIAMNFEINIPEIAAALRNNFPCIPFAYIFGSSVDGIVKNGSDIDIAIWYDGNDPFLKVKVLEILEPHIKSCNLDIVNICNANPILAHEAIAGKILFVREDQKQYHASIYTKILASYEDRTYWIKKQLQYRGYEVQWSN
jgi:predicted nucleotidyltransferase